MMGITRLPELERNTADWAEEALMADSLYMEGHICAEIDGQTARAVFRVVQPVNQKDSATVPLGTN